MIRFTIVITPAMFAALSKASDQEHQDMRNMATRILSEGLQRRGLLENEDDPSGRAGITDPLRAGSDDDLIISTAAATSTRGDRHAHN